MTLEFLAPRIAIAHNVLPIEDYTKLYDYAVSVKLANGETPDNTRQYGKKSFQSLDSDKPYELDSLINFWGSKNVFTHSASPEIREIVDRLNSNCVDILSQYLEKIDDPKKNFERSSVAFSPIHVYVEGHKFDLHEDCFDYALVFYLNNSDEYSGGELVYLDGPIIRPIAGSLVISPSLWKHEVIEVTSGIRCSMTTFLSTF
jgi:hypothetical protein